MSLDLLEAGTQIAAIATIVIGFAMLALGYSTWLGNSFRTAIEPVLTAVRRHSELSRADLAEVSTLVACGLAALEAVIGRNPFALGLAVLLWLSRPAIARLTGDEHPLLALANSFAIDLMIGLYVPITIAQVLLRNLLMGASFLALIIALSWPAGGGATRRRFRFVGLS